MLKELSINNFALIDDLKINFVGGFNVFTGETGSGKSIILDALSLVLGKRADRNLIRKNKKKSVIEAVFFVRENDESIRLFLEKEEIDPNEGTIFLRRELFEDGHSTARINGKIVTTATLKNISFLLLSIHEQNEFDEIMVRENQLDILDSFAGTKTLSDYILYQEKYAYYIEICKALKEINDLSRTTDINREMDILEYQIAEIRQAEPFLKEADQIENQILTLERSEEISSSIHSAYESIYLGRENILDKMNFIIKQFEKFSGIDERLDEWFGILQENYYSMEDLARSIKSESDHFIYDERLLEELLQKNNLLNKIFSKYGSDYNEVMKFYEQIIQKKDHLSNLETEKENLNRKKNEAENELSVLSKKITKNRQEEALSFEQFILDELQSIGMTNARFKIQFDLSDEYTLSGKDRICFMVSFNKGEDLKPFNKVASGGEISRFVLSIKKVTAGSNRVQTMVFDEIDSGISGVSANAVGRKLKEISKNKQVICITHLPQVAANADFHYLVSKYEDGNNTYTKVKLLREELRIEELAKMISGDEITQNSINYARELIRDAKIL